MNCGVEHECKPVSTCLRGANTTSGGTSGSRERVREAWEDAFSRGGNDLAGITQTLYWEKNIHRLHTLHRDTHPVLWRYTAGKSRQPRLSASVSVGTLEDLRPEHRKPRVLHHSADSQTDSQVE